MLPVKESLWKLEFVQGVLRKPTFKVSLNQVSNSWDIFDMDNVTWTNAASINVTVIVGICSRCSQESSIKVLSNRVGNRWDIADIEFVWVGGVGWCAKLFSCLTQLMFMLRWVGLLTIILTKLYVWKISIESKSISWFLFRNGLTTVLKLGVQLRNRFRVVEG